MFGKLSLLGCFFAAAALAPNVAYAQTITCQGGITGNCTAPSSYTCSVPMTPVSMSESCNPIKCTAAGQTPTAQSINLTGTGICGCSNCGVLSMKDCPPTFSQQLSIAGANASETLSLTVSSYVGPGICVVSSTVTYSSTCNSNCTCSQ